MTKLICINNIEYNTNVYKGDIVLSSDWNHNYLMISIFNDNYKFLGLFHKKDFITLNEFREQKINKILYD